MTDIIERLRAEAARRDAMASMMSNTGRPREDNDEGRCAQLLEDAAEEIDALGKALDLVENTSVERLVKIREQDAEIERLRGRIAGLEDRLEIDHVWVPDPDNENKLIRKEVPPEEREDFPCDGIDSRNETIKLQDALIKKQGVRIAELEQMFSALRQVINGTATVTDRFPDSGTPRVDVRELVEKLGRDERP
jgi:hypothetical protein